MLLSMNFCPVKTRYYTRTVAACVMVGNDAEITEKNMAMLLLKTIHFS